MSERKKGGERRGGEGRGGGGGGGRGGEERGGEGSGGEGNERCSKSIDWYVSLTIRNNAWWYVHRWSTFQLVIHTTKQPYQ